MAPQQKCRWQTVQMYKTDTGADLGFWFGRGSSRASGDGRDRGQSPGGSLGPSPQKLEECYVMRLKKQLMVRKNKSIQTEIVWQSTHRFVSSHFCLKLLSQSASSRLREMVNNGSQFCGATAVQSVVFWHAGHCIRCRNNIGLIKRVSWNEYFCNVR